VIEVSLLIDTLFNALKEFWSTENYRILINLLLSKLKLKFSSEIRTTIIKIITTIKITINNNNKEVSKEEVNKEDKRVIPLNLPNKTVRKMKEENKNKSNLLLLLRLLDKS